MDAWKYPAFVGCAFAVSFLMPGPASGQSSGCAIESPPTQNRQTTRINVLSVEFSGESPLSDEDRAQFRNEIQSLPLFVDPNQNQNDADWFQAPAELIRDALANRGYFRALVTGTPFLERAGVNEMDYALQIEIKSGPLYHMGEIGLTNSLEKQPLAFDVSTLRQKIPIQVGDIFDVSKVRDGLRAITRLYGTKGYVDMTAEPEFKIKETEGEIPTIDVLLRIDEQIAYRLRNVRLLGLDQKTSQKLSLPEQTGDLVNWSLWEDFFNQVESRMAPNASEAQNIRVHKDGQDGILDIDFDFRPCRQDPEPADLPTPILRRKSIPNGVASSSSPRPL